MSSRYLITGFCIFLLLIVLSHSWPDEALDSRLQQVRTEYESSRSSPEMAYRLYGFAAPRGQDPLVYGQKAVEFYKANGNFPENPTPLRFTIDSRCLLSRGTCSLDDVFSNLPDVPSLLEANDDLLARYEMLQSAPAFSHVLRPAPRHPVLPLRNLLLAQFLILRQIVYLAANSETDVARSVLQREIGFHRDLLANADRINLKMVALLLVEEDIRLRVLLLGKGLEPGDNQPVARLNERERSAVAAFTHEIMIDLNGLYRGASKGDLARMTFDGPFQRAWFRLLPFRRNATANRLDLPILELAEASSSSPENLLAFMEDWTPMRVGLEDRLSNGAGLMLIERWKPPPLWNFLFRIHDLDRKLLLATIAERMLQEDVTGLTAHEWLATLSPEYRDPLTGELPLWKDGQLGYPDLDLAGIELPSRPAIDLPLP